MKILILTFAVLFSAIVGVGQTSDAALRRVIDTDKAARDASGKLPTLSAAEHLSRAETYSANRLFPQAR
ncbi:MAG: hypothetical protein IT174_09585, partial [Acidobacteria bacterium]|nr:hypothetical protein [Acidobacteriota bacterium]